MTAKIIEGAKVAEEIRAEVTAKAKELRAKGIVPKLACVLVGDDPASLSYVRGKSRACEECSMEEDTINLPATTTTEELIELVGRLNKDPQVHGILVQLPLPRQIDENKVLLAIDPIKDVDGFHPVNVGKLLIGEPDYMPCTPAGIQQMLIRSGYDPEGKHVVIVGRSNIVGKPMFAILCQRKPGANATITMCHTRTKDLSSITLQADILIAAAGAPEMIKADMVREGAVVIDVGVNRVDDPTRKKGYRLVGDVDFEAVKEKAAAITPVPGGVGPMTITMLMVNTVRAAEIYGKPGA